MTLTAIPADFFSHNKGYILRISAYGSKVNEFLEKCCGEKSCGIIVSSTGLAKPDTNEISLCLNSMGQERITDRETVKACLSDYLHIPEDSVVELCEAILNIQSDMQKSGSNENIIRNVTVKFMFWLKKYCGASLASGENNTKLLVQIPVSKHELWFFAVLAAVGQDIVLIETEGDEKCAQLDSEGKYSSMLELGDKPFPRGFSLNDIRQQLARQQSFSAQFNDPSLPKICTNAWISGEIFDDVRRSPAERGNESNTVYNCYARINGVENKATYLSDLFRIYSEIKDSRRFLLLDEGFPAPTNEEIADIRRGNYNDIFALISGMSANLVHSSVTLQKLMRRAFAEVMKGYFDRTNDLRKSLNIGVYVLCWMKRWQKTLFSGWKLGECACFMMLGVCHSSKEECFVKMLSRLPCDVIQLVPDLKLTRLLTDELLYERNFTDTLEVKSFPKAESELSMGTVAYYAERELDEIMYNDATIFRDFQFKKANAILLNTMYEEIKLLWGQDLKFRPNFSVSGDIVNMPVIAARVSGVKGGSGGIKDYRRELCEYITGNTLVINNRGIIAPPSENTFGFHLVSASKLCREQILKSSDYRYGMLRGEIQDYILEKLQVLLDKDIVDDAPEHIAKVCLSLSSDIVRMIQSFDFTKSNPKILYLNTTEKVISLEDSIALAFMSVLGFDILMFIPTGYMSCEKYYRNDFFVSHQIGDYCYDMPTPRLSPVGQKQSIFKRIFG